jgi:hypothetical protein
LARLKTLSASARDAAKLTLKVYDSHIFCCLVCETDYVSSESGSFMAIFWPIGARGGLSLYAAFAV